MIQTKRIYSEYQEKDGFRILVDRLWPRGVSKEKAKFDLWLKEIAPSNSLRKWYAHDPEKWDGFKSRYKNELKEKSQLLLEIKQLEKKEKVITLLFSAKNEQKNNAHVLKEILESITDFLSF